MQRSWPSIAVEKVFIQNRYPPGEPLAVRPMRMSRSRHASSASVEGRQEAHPAAREGIAAQGEGAGGSGCAADPEKKSPGDLGRQRGRLINVPDRLLCVSLIREAAQSGC